MATAVIVYALNLADLACTLYALEMGVPEMNPLLQNIPGMVAYKVAGVGAICWWLAKRPERIARWGLRLCAAIYAVLLMWHCAGIIAIT